MNRKLFDENFELSIKTENINHQIKFIRKLFQFQLISEQIKTIFF